MMDFSRGKSITTSVPSMAIRFNATAEEIEEIYASEEEQNDNATSDVPPISGSSELESSPRRLILPLLGKRSTSIDTNSGGVQDASPPSDPWRFLSDIKGKITKSVEGKLTEYKARTHDGDGSPKLPKTVKDSKENSSLSDSEEVSESSISKTCGIISTTEGVEMSSDDETPSLSERDKPHNETTAQQLMNTSSSSSGLRQRFRIANKNAGVIKEGSVSTEFLENVQKINDGQDSEIESGVDVLADLNISNFNMDDDNVLNVTQVSGSDVRTDVLAGRDETTVFSPVGFVDLRPTTTFLTWFEVIYSFRYFLCVLMCLVFYFSLPLTHYFNGFASGALMMLSVCYIYFKLLSPKIVYTSKCCPRPFPIVEIPAAREYQPLKKYEGWVNEYPEEYDPHSYHVTQTQSVYLKLQGNYLKVSHGRQRIPKRAMWNEPEHKLSFINHRIYNLLGAKVTLLPQGLAKVRHWSKKYPICITLNKNQVNFEFPVKKSKESKHTIKKKEQVETQVFSKLADEAEEPRDSSNLDVAASYSSVIPAVDSCVMEDGVSSLEKLDDADYEDDEDDDDGEFCDISTWQDATQQENSEMTNIYIFGRTGREKEDWFRRLTVATHRFPDHGESSPTEDSDFVLNNLMEDDYLKFMSKMSNFISFCEEFTASKSSFYDERKEAASQNNKEDVSCESVWVNALMARVLFDCLRERSIVQRIKDRIQRKLSSIKLPYFIQALYCEELNLGNTTPHICTSAKPTLNHRGLWIDLDITYEGLIVVILHTKLDLLKLRQPHVLEEKLQKEKSAIFHSDVDDSAESSTDEDCGNKVVVNSSSVLDSAGQPVPGLGGSSNKSKKLMKMVDRIAESKFFQAAAENKYIKKAMEGVSNTDLRLKVELKKCSGTLVLNIPPPPSDRLWLGFRVPPELVIAAHPIVGERNINLNRVTSWIEKKIYKEFQKLLVLPNMEDLLIPVMSPKLPE